MRDAFDYVALGVVVTAVLASIGWLLDSDGFIVLVAVVHLSVQLVWLVRVTWREILRFGLNVLDLLLGIVWLRASERTGDGSRVFR